MNESELITFPSRYARIYGFFFPSRVGPIAAHPPRGVAGVRVGSIRRHNDLRRSKALTGKINTFRTSNAVRPFAPVPIHVPDGGGEAEERGGGEAGRGGGGGGLV